VSVPPPDVLPPDFETHMPDDLDVKHCYRHPRRETGVSCSNCGRPICHECMIPAPVGFRCPECIKEQNARGTRAKVVTRGQIRSRWGAAGGVVGTGGITVTKVLVALNVLYFLVELVTGAATVMGGYVPKTMVDLGALYVPDVLVLHEYWRMFSSMFLHQGILHLALNMWALWVVGRFVEASLGRVKFLVIYFVSGFAGSVLVLVAAPPYALVVGASGAIAGIFGALAVHAFLNRGRDFQSRALLNSVIFILVLNVVLNVSSSQLSWQAHVGGIVAGAAAMYAFMLGGRKDPRGAFTRSDVVSVLVIVFVLVALTWWRVTTFIA
jgi:membrane associated rhomboid family serine protease